MSISSVCFVVPTYNEAENIAPMVRQLLAIADGLKPIEAQVLVVDDESPDGTGDIVREIQAGDERVHLLTGPKQGLGSAYTRGFEHVLNELDVDAIVQMDADFSHAPTDTPRLIDALAHADVVIGSRYVEGGSLDPNWGRWRRFLSYMGNLFARYVAGIYKVRDCTAGFKAIRVSALRRAFPLRLRGAGLCVSGGAAARADDQRCQHSRNPHPLQRPAYGRNQTRA